MSIKIQYENSHLEEFLENLGNVEHCERTHKRHQDIEEVISRKPHADLKLLELTTKSDRPCRRSKLKRVQSIIMLSNFIFIFNFNSILTLPSN